MSLHSLWNPDLEAWQKQDTADQAAWDQMTDDEKRATVFDTVLARAAISTARAVPVASNVETPQRVRVSKPTYIEFSANGNGNSNPRVLTPGEATTRKKDILDALGTKGMSALYRGERIELERYNVVVWYEDWGKDVTRNPITETREAATNAARKEHGRTEIKEEV